MIEKIKYKNYRGFGRNDWSKVQKPKMWQFWKLEHI